MMYRDTHYITRNTPYLAYHGLISRRSIKRIGGLCNNDIDPINQLEQVPTLFKHSYSISH